MSPADTIRLLLSDLSEGYAEPDVPDRAEEASELLDALMAVGERDKAEHYDELLDAERRALAFQEFIAWTLDEFGARMPDAWKARAQDALKDSQ